MHQLRRVKLRPLFTLAASLVLGAAVMSAQEMRFSGSLSAADRTAAGLTKLTSDQVAVVDALVRRDAAQRGGSSNATTAGDKANANATFSQRATAQERGTMGLATLSRTELAQLDAFVERYENARLARTLLAPPIYLARNPRGLNTEKKQEREIHGSFSLSYGMGSGGYSEKTGSMVLSMEDPEKRYSITVGYTESHVKGGYVYRDPFFYGDLTHGPYLDDPIRP